MPSRAARPCGKAGCPVLVTDSRYCPEHTDQTKQVDRWRGSSASRGYDSDHRKLRAEVLKEARYLCQRCLSLSRVTVATDMHHIKKIVSHPHLRLAKSNCIAVCRDCHEDLERTA